MGAGHPRDAGGRPLDQLVFRIGVHDLAPLPALFRCGGSRFALDHSGSTPRALFLVDTGVGHLLPWTDRRFFATHRSVLARRITLKGRAGVCAPALPGLCSDQEGPTLVPIVMGVENFLGVLHPPKAREDPLVPLWGRFVAFRHS